MNRPAILRHRSGGRYWVPMRYRFLTRPSWLASIAALVMVAALFVRLGWWQFDRAHRQHKVSAVELAQRKVPVPLDELLKAGAPATDSAVGRAVVISGTFDGSRQLLVPDRVLAGRTGYYAIAPFKLPDGTVVVVNRGWTANASVPVAPTGSVTVTGWLALPETADGATPAADFDAAKDPAHRIAAVDIASLVNIWPYQLDRSYVSALSQDPADVSGLASVPAPPPPSGKTDWNVLNLGYFAQWWLFAGVAFWWFAAYVRRIALGPAEDEDDPEEDEAAIPRSPAPQPESVPASERQ
jgi:cytochrome oxidase assembly protein ShyY1